MNDLEKLGLKYGTDKIGKHNYLPVYHNLFKDRRDTVKKVLEIGAGEGLGLRMFRDYFPNAMIYGGEIEDSRLFDDDRIMVIKCDQSKPLDLSVLLEVTGTDIDLFIDDGSHRPQDQLSTVLTVFPKLNTGSIYVIEDVAEKSILESLPREWNVDLVTCGKRYDDRLIICRK
jgi:hypothetical protein